METKRVIFSLLSLCAFFQLGAIPPPLPSAGVVERDIEKEYEAEPLDPQKEIPNLQIDIPDEKLDIPDGTKIFISRIVIQGNQAISEQEILNWVEPYLHQDLSIKDIYGLCSVIDQGYAKKGYFLARAYPPPQDIHNETLVINVIEGCLGNITVVGNNYYSDIYIRSFFRKLKYQPLRYDQFMRALMLLNETPDLQAGAIFEKGKDFGCVDVIINVVDVRPIHFYFNGNNYGRNLTTNARVGGRFDWGNYITEGDTLSIAEVVGLPVNALYFTDVRYKTPLSRNGTFMEMSYLYSQFKIEELKDLNLRGRSNIAALKFEHALVRTRPLNVDLFYGFDYKQIRNYAQSQTTSFDKLRVLSLGTNLDFFNPVKGRNVLNIRIAAGLPNFLGGMSAVDPESSSDGGGGRFFKFNADYDWLCPLPRSSLLTIHGSIQLSPSNLTIPEQIYIGGIDTIRGFPLAIAIGNSGYYLNFEVRTPPPFLANKKFFKLNKTWKETVQICGFIDQGGIFLHEAQKTYLWGTGFGLKINGPCHLSLSLDVGFPLNHRNLASSVSVYLKLTGQFF